MKKKADSFGNHLAFALPQRLIRLAFTVESATEGFPQMLPPRRTSGEGPIPQPCVGDPFLVSPTVPSEPHA